MKICDIFEVIQDANKKIMDIIVKKKTLKEQKMGKWVSLCCTVAYKRVTVMDGVKF